ncbi:MAG: multicopper oxidase family protein [Candidatus Korobacteraceae bacterium]
MSRGVSRRKFLATSFGALIGSTVLPDRSFAGPLHFLQPAVPRSQPASLATTIRATKRTLEINGKAANVLGLLQPNGTQGMSSAVNEPFRVTLENKLTVPTAIHWHGLHPPNTEDGVPGVTQPLIRADASAFYNFPIRPAGTHWMHSHQGLQEAFLLAAPLIVHDPADRPRDEQEVVLFLSDFSFTPPKEIYARLRQNPKGVAVIGEGEPLTMSGTGGATPAQNSQSLKTAPDANDVNYDAYLANDRTLIDPEVVQVEKGGRVRLRIINGSSGTNFFIDLGALNGELIATDGMPVKSIQGTRFPLAIAQRIDVKVQLPRDGGAFPILALRELATEQAGIVLATSGAPIQRVPVKNASSTGLLTLGLESQLAAAKPLKDKVADQVAVLRLQGNMSHYEWLINGQAFDVNNPGSQQPQVRVKPGQRVGLKFVNETPMSHPMHLHGHSFQVVAINDRRFNGALRDTILVPGRNSVTVEFDANNPGLWFVHCHVLWHLEAGMATLVQYEA